MARQGQALPPFLQKLRHITETNSSDLSGWSDDGLSYVVKDSDRFEQALKQHFKGNLQTFVRQLHFYGFRKVDAAAAGAWSFVHKSFRRDRPDLLRDIKRKSRADTQSSASQVEVAQLRSQVAQLQDVVEDLRSQLDNVLNVLDDAGMTTPATRRGGSSSNGAAASASSAAGRAAGSRKRTRLAQGLASLASSPSSGGRLRAAQLRRGAGDLGGLSSEDDDDEHDDDVEHDDDAADAFMRDASLLPPLPPRAGAAAPLAERQSSMASFSELCGALEPLDATTAAVADGLSELDLSVDTDELYRSLVKLEPGAAADTAAADSASQASHSSRASGASGASEAALDASSVSRVLGFFKQVKQEEDAFTQLRDLTKFQKNLALPAQQVGAN